MNKFILILHEEFDQYTCMVPHPIVTAHTREEIIEVFQSKLNEIIVWKEQNQNRARRPHWIGNIKNVLDVIMGVSLHEFSDQDSQKVIAEVLTVDEFFEKYSNQRFTL